MKKTLTTVAAVVACAGTQLFAQNAKDAVITFALTAQGQSSVSTIKSALNAGNWTAPPLYYKTATKKIATVDILRAIAQVVHKNAGYYSAQSSLVLVQGELSGFFNLGEDLATAGAPLGVATNTTSFTTTVDGLSVRLASGRHFLPNPTSGAWPVGHHQPWGQIFVKDPSKGLCENVTFFFSITIQECYDCFYLNSFISDATFSLKTGAVNGPPCCGTSANLLGNGKDSYYMTLSFDNTANNPYLNEGSDAYIGYAGSEYEGIQAVDIQQQNLPADGLTPDLLTYSEAIASGLGHPSPYLMRFTLNGIVTYTWSLKFINASDVLPDFIGNAKYAANGYGFIALTCWLLNGSATINEKLAKVSTCCLDQPWYDNTVFSSWYGTGWNQAQVPWSDFFGSPVNTPVDLSFHFGFDEEYEVGEQWLTNPDPAVALPTLDAERTSFVPVGR